MSTAAGNPSGTSRYGAEIDTNDLASGRRVVPFRAISWAAVIAGVVLALAVQLGLSMLGTGIGLSTVDPVVRETPSAATLGLSAALWWTVSSLIAMLIGGYVAAALTDPNSVLSGVVHGLLVWAVATLVAVYLVSSAAGSVASGVASVVGRTASGLGQVAAAVAPQVADAARDNLPSLDSLWTNIKQEVNATLRQTGKPALQPGAIAQSSREAASGAAQEAGSGDLEGALDRVLRRAQGTTSQADRDALINIVAARMNVSRDEAARTVQGWEKSYQEGRAAVERAKAEAEQKAREVADQTARAASQASLWAFIAMGLGALVAAWAGALGRRYAVRQVPTVAIRPLG